MNHFGTPRRSRVLLALFILAGIAGLFIFLRATRNEDAAAAKAAATQKAKEDVASGAKADAAAKRSATKSDREKLANLDRRATQVARPAAERDAALAKLRAKVPGVDVQFDPITGSANHVMAAGKFLTGVAAVADPVNGDFYAPVRNFIAENAAIFGHGAEAIEGTRITREDVTAHSGMRTIVWQQELGGVPIYNTILKANLTKRGELVTLGSHFMSDPAAAAQLPPAERAALIAQPPVDVAKAVSLAAAHLGDAVAPEQARAISDPQGAERWQRFQAPKLSDTNAGLTWLPMSASEVRLAWDVTLMSLAQNEMFRVVVDAQSGEVLMRTAQTAITGHLTDEREMMAGMV